MVEKVRTFWDDLPETGKRWFRRGSYVGGVLVALLSGPALTGAVLPDAPGIAEEIRDTQEKLAVQTARLDTIRAEQDRTSRGVQFLVCRDKRREEALTLEFCDRFWTADDDFLPPARMR